MLDNFPDKELIDRILGCNRQDRYVSILWNVERERDFSLLLVLWRDDHHSVDKEIETVFGDGD